MLEKASITLKKAIARVIDYTETGLNCTEGLLYITKGINRSNKSFWQCLWAWNPETIA
jgi:hypothetical protein